MEHQGGTPVPRPVGLRGLLLGRSFPPWSPRGPDDLPELLTRVTGHLGPPDKSDFRLRPSLPSSLLFYLSSTTAPSFLRPSTDVDYHNVEPSDLLLRSTSLAFREFKDSSWGVEVIGMEGVGRPTRTPCTVRGVGPDLRESTSPDLEEGAREGTRTDVSGYLCSLPRVPDPSRPSCLTGGGPRTG